MHNPDETVAARNFDTRCDDPVTACANAAGASPEQVYNLAGNVAEWVADWAGSYPAGPQTDPTGPVSGTTKVVRGGAFSSPLPAAISYARMAIDPTVGLKTLGKSTHFPSSERAFLVGAEVP